VPRPRNAGFDQRILRAASEVLDEVGYDAFSMTEVARRAGVGRPALYRRFADRGELVLSLLVSSSLPPVDAVAGSAVDALATALRQLADSLADVPRAAIGAQLGMAIADEDVSRRVVAQSIGPATDRMMEIWRRGVESGELRADLDGEVALTTVSASIIQPLLILHWPVDGPWIDQVIEQFFEGARARG
jgi:AcrR family transcriptional regulator